ncbi:MAG: formate/nitrite transporter family protein [Clostridiales bacterium]|nr:formate/nitrite transporter family protein [Clostridiales bacterium]
MFIEEYNSLANSAVKKTSLLKNNFLAYFMLSVLAGMFIGLGVILVYTIYGLCNANPYAKIIMGGAFSAALSLVIFAGAELYTSNTMIMGAGILKRKIKFLSVLKLIIVCYLGNLIGAILLSTMFHFSGLNTGITAKVIAETAQLKMTLPIEQLFLRGVLCNILVCLAVWCTYKCKSESGKLIMIFWCMLAFFTVGYEHCVANMTVMTIALFKPSGEALSLAGYAYNLAISTVANLIGGVVFVALPYFIASKNTTK